MAGVQQYLSDQRNSTRILVALCLSLVAIDVLLVSQFWTYLNKDLRFFLIPWYRFLWANGRIAALGHNFYDYMPTYIYLLDLGTIFDRFLDVPNIVRAISLIFNAVASVLVFKFALGSGWSITRAVLIAILFFLLPESVLNSGVWAQCDMIYSFFLMAFVYAIIEKKSWIAMMMLGIAFSFKLQTVFIGPFALYLLLVGRIRWYQVLVVPAAYVCAVLPAALLGRPWHDLATIYLKQADGNPLRLLSRYAANPYYLIDIYIPDPYDFGIRIGLALSVVVALLLTFLFLRRGKPLTREKLLMMATLSLTIMPYVLPEMHERYFFPAGMMAFLLAVVRPRTWPLVVLIQMANVLSYMIFFFGLGASAWLELGIAVMTGAIGLSLWLFWREPVEERSTSPRRSALSGTAF